MQRIIRYFVIGVVAAIVFLAAIVSIFLAVFDANTYKDDLSALVLEHTGRDLQFHGDVSLTVFPALGMKLGAMSLSNAEGFGPQPMIKVRQASVSVDLGSLIALAPEVDKLVLRDLEIDLQQNSAGITNWQDLVPAESGDTASSAPEPDPPTPDSAGVEIQGAFGGLDLQNIRISWKDAQTDTEFLIRDLDLTTGRIAPNQAFPLTLHVDASASDGLAVVLDLETRVEYLIEQQQLTLSDLTLGLNEFRIGGRLQVRNFAKPAIAFDLNSPNLDLDALLAGQSANQTATVDQPGQGTAEEDTRIELPMQTLRDLDIDGKLGIAQLRAQNLTMSDLEINLRAKDGLLTLKPVKLAAYGGIVESAVIVDAKSDAPRYGISKTVKGLRIGDLLEDYSGREIISGGLNAEVNLTTRGEWLSELKSNSNGRLQLGFSDGAINGFNLRHSIDAAKARIRGEDPPTEELLKTDFSSLTVSGTVRNGIFTSDDLDLQAPLLRVGGKGSADLNTETVNYLVSAKLVGTLEGQEGKDTDDLDGLEIPVRIKGPFDSAKIDVQLDEMLKARADAKKAKLKADIEKQKKELQQQLEAEKKALAESRKREAEKKKAIEKAKLKKKKEEAKKKAKEKLLEQLTD